MRLILIVTTVFFTHFAFGKTIFEPSLSVGIGSGEASISEGALAGQSASGDGTVASFGFRYGITRRYIHLTGIVEGTVFTGDNIDPEFIGFGGIGIGYEWNIPLRTYFIAGAWDFDTDFVGTGFELSYLWSDSFWIGVRYINFKTELVNEFTSGAVSSTVAAEIDLSTVSVVVSFPFEFNYPDHWFRKTDWE